MTWGFVVCGPNEAMVVSGCFFRKPAMISGGRKFVWPVVHKLQKISLNTMTLIITSPRIYTQLGVPVTVTGVAQIKINGSDKKMLATACEQFLGKTEDEIRDIAKETLEAHQRAIMGNMTVEEIYKDRKKFSSSVFEVASSDMINMGISVVSYTLKDIQDEEGYLKALGEARTAQVKRDARIGEAEAKKDSGIKEAYAEQLKRSAQFSNEVEIAKAFRDYEIKRADFEKEVQTMRAQSDLSYDLQAAKTQQAIKEEEMQIKVIERTRRIEVERLEILRQDKFLEATIRKPAEAERYRLEKIGEAEMNQICREAEADAERTRRKGEARAKAIFCKAQAEAEQMALKAEAWKKYEDAARLNMILDMLPLLAAEIAAPLANCEKISMVCTGSGEIGASKMTKEILDIMEKLPKVIQTITGVNITESMQVESFQ